MPVVKLIYGIHKPKYVSDSSVVKYSNRLGLQDEIYRLKNYSSASRSKYQYLGNSMPEILLFNSQGQLTKFDIGCSNDLDSIVMLSLHDIDNMHVEGKNLQDFISDTYIINPLNKDDLTIRKVPLYVVKFAEYAGRLNKDNVPGQMERLSNRNDVQFILLNMDYSVCK